MRCGTGAHSTWTCNQTRRYSCSYYIIKALQSHLLSAVSVCFKGGQLSPPSSSGPPQRRLFGRRHPSLTRHSFGAFADHFCFFKSASTSIPPETKEDETSSQGHPASVFHTARLLKPILGCYQRAQTHRGPTFLERFIHRPYLISGSFNSPEIYWLQQTYQLH